MLAVVLGGRTGAFDHPECFEDSALRRRPQFKRIDIDGYLWY